MAHGNNSRSSIPVAISSRNELDCGQDRTAVDRFGIFPIRSSHGCSSRAKLGKRKAGVTHFLLSTIIVIPFSKVQMIAGC
jgi:hypothetical protein